jgi:NADP-dependent 3-hydroxy acid dehydrogenase YdfG
MASSAEAVRVLRGRVAVVTGASSGIGRSVAVLLAAAGAKVVLAARSAERLREAAREVSDAAGPDGSGVVVCEADVATEAGVDRLAAVAGAADIVVHAAGAFGLAPLVETSVESFDRMLAVNVRAAFLLVRAFVPAMLERGHGDVVIIGSVAGRHAFPANGAYSASKFGVRGMHAVLAAELRGTGVRATFVEPAATDTPLWDDIDRGSNPGLPERESMLSPEAVAHAVVHAVTVPRDVVIPNILVERA